MRALFDTAIGRCAIAWTPRGVCRVWLPEAEPGDAAPPPPEVAAAITAIQALLAGAARDLREIELDWSAVGAFDRAVYEATRAIGPGATRTYGELARTLSRPGAARAIGRSLGANPFPIIIPCHRVLAAGGAPGGFSAPGGVETKLRMLRIEGAAPPRLPGL